MQFQNGETCLHAAAISGHPELVQLLLDAKSDPLLTNSAGQSPLELLIMFINYGNISLTPNLLKVLNLLLPSDSDKIKSCAFNSNGIIPPEEMGKIRKLVRIYCPFNIQHNHESKVNKPENFQAPSASQSLYFKFALSRSGNL